MRDLALSTYTICINEEKGMITAIRDTENLLLLQESFWKIECTHALNLTIADMEEFSYTLHGQEQLIMIWKKGDFRVKVSVERPSKNGVSFNSDGNEETGFDGCKNTWNMVIKLK